MSLSLVTGPTVEPISVAQFKLHARITRDDEDGLIAAYITAARKYVETAQRRQLVTATWRLSLEQFPGWELVLPLSPLQTISSITYVETDGTTQTISSTDYIVDTYRTPGLAVPAYGLVWPVARCQPNSVRVTFVAGYGDTGSTVPETTRQAVRLLASHYYENREPFLTGTISSSLPLAVESLIAVDAPGVYP